MAGDLHEQDFIGWTEQQARLLREAAAQGTNLPLDWELLAEEVEDLGRSQYDAVFSQLVRIYEHLLKLEFSPAIEPRGGWVESVNDARRKVEVKLVNDPGLRPRLSEMLGRAVPVATRRAEAGLSNFGEHAAAAALHAAHRQYTPDQLLEDWLPERPDLPALTRA